VTTLKDARIDFVLDNGESFAFLTFSLKKLTFPV